MAAVRASAGRAHAWISSQLDDPLELLRRMKFEQIGFHPLEDRKLNLIGQINQTWTFAVASYRLANGLKDENLEEDDADKHDGSKQRQGARTKWLMIGGPNVSRRQFENCGDPVASWR